MVIIDEDGVDNDVQTVGRAATTCGVQIDQLVNDTLWPSGLASSLGFNQLFPSQAVCAANGLNTDRKVPTQCGNPPLLWNKLVESGSCGAPNGNGRLVYGLVDNPSDGGGVNQPDTSANPTEDPYMLEARMTFIGGNSYRAVFTIPAGINLDGRRLSIQTDEGGAYNVFVQ